MNSRCVKIGKDENICDTLDHSFGSYAALSVCVFACLGGRCWTALFYTTQIGHIGVIWDAKILDTLSTPKFFASKTRRVSGACGTRQNFWHVGYVSTFDISFNRLNQSIIIKWDNR